jgi:GH15 family glucan-1,4-alpha-glucosidase
VTGLFSANSLPIRSPISDYAFLSDCEVTALVAPNGSVEWLCLPRLDSPSVFGSLLDRDAGGFRFSPSGVQVPVDRRYLPGTMIMESTWGMSTGWAIVHHVLLMGPWQQATDRVITNRRAPTDYEAEHILLRIVRCVSGSMQVVLDCEPLFDYGRKAAKWEYGDKGFNEGIAHDGVDLHLRLTTDMRLGFEGGRATTRTLLQAGEARFCALGWSTNEPVYTLEDAEMRLERTADYWRHWLDRGKFPDHRWGTYLQRSALTLKGLTYAPTGAVTAAATTSLPETIGGERNWDYRYTWFRDSMFALSALYAIGFDGEANDFYWFVADVADRDGDKLQIMYGVDGESDLQEHILTHLEGYENSKPVRIGNAAYKQNQHDLWGSVVTSIYLYSRSQSHGRLDDRAWRILQNQVTAALSHWREPDQGLWEVRGPAQHFVASKLMCWVAVSLGAGLARIREEHVLAEQWEKVAEEIKADVLSHGVSDRGVFRQHYDTDALDASLLLIPLLGMFPPDNKIVIDTVLTIAKELQVDGLLLRYKVDETDDGLGSEEGTFTICSFWLVSALVKIGKHKQALELCEKLLNLASPLGLYAEELDLKTNRHLGNFPQAFTHLALITAVLDVMEIS